jgi:anti-sigma factor RsiW
MHAVIIDDLEDYLAGTLPSTVERRFQGHLETCGACRREIQEMQAMRDLVACLAPVDAVEPPPEFVARVMYDVARQPAPTFWSIFGDFAFGRRVAFAVLLMLAALGTVLVSRETAYAPAPPTPQAVMASDEGSPKTADGMLVT